MRWTPSRRQSEVESCGWWGPRTQALSWSSASFCSPAATDTDCTAQICPASPTSCSRADEKLSSFTDASGIAIAAGAGNELPLRIVNTGKPSCSAMLKETSESSGSCITWGGASARPGNARQRRPNCPGSFAALSLSWRADSEPLRPLRTALRSPAPIPARPRRRRPTCRSRQRPIRRGNAGRCGVGVSRKCESSPLTGAKAPRSTGYSTARPRRACLGGCGSSRP